MTDDKHTWSGPEVPHWSRRHHLGHQSQCLWTRCDLEESKQKKLKSLVGDTTQKYTEPKVGVQTSAQGSFVSSLENHVHFPRWLPFCLPTVVILNTEHKVTAGVANSFYCDARELVHRGLGKQLPCDAQQKKHVHHRSGKMVQCAMQCLFCE